MLQNEWVRMEEGWPPQKCWPLLGPVHKKNATSANICCYTVEQNALKFTEKSITKQQKMTQKRSKNRGPTIVNLALVRAQLSDGKHKLHTCNHACNGTGNLQLFMLRLQLQIDCYVQ